MKSKSKAAEEVERDRGYASAEEVDDDDLDGDLNLSDEEDNAQKFRARNKMMKAGKKAVLGDRKYRQEIDTNIFRIKFSTLG